jgi:fucose permease
VYFICRTVGAFIGVFIMTRIKDITYYRINILTCICAILALALIPMSATLTLALIGAIGFLCSCIFPTIFAMAVKEEPQRANLISGLMITAVAGGGAVPPLIGWANDSFQTITAGILALLVCAIYLTYCAFFVKHKPE